MRFRIGDIPVRVDLSFWLIMGLFGFQRATLFGGFESSILISWVVLVFVGILLHELGHAIAFRAYGRSPQVTLYAMGGLTTAAGGLSARQRLVSTLAGPFAGFGLGALVLGVFASGLWQPGVLEGASVGQVLGAALPFPDIVNPGQIGEQILLDLIFINVGWGLLNLVPLHPLDGGQSLEALLGVLKVKQAERVTAAVGVVVAALGAVLALRSGQIFILLIVIFLGYSNIRRLTARGSTAGSATPSGSEAQVLSAELQQTLQLVDQALAQGQTEQAVEMITQEHTYRPTAQSLAARLAVLARVRRLDELEQVLAEHREAVDHTTLSSCAAALVSGGRFEAGLQAAEAAWNADTSNGWKDAVTAAAARAGLRDVDGALRWLYAAADRGWTDRRRLESDPLFAEVRADPRVGDVLARMGV